MFWVIIYNNRFINGGFVMKKKSFITMDNYNTIDKIEIPADVKASAKEVTE